MSPYSMGKMWCKGCDTYRWPRETFTTLKGRLLCVVCKTPIRKNERKIKGGRTGDSSPRI